MQVNSPLVYNLGFYSIGLGPVAFQSLVCYACMFVLSYNDISAKIWERGYAGVE